MNKRTFLKATPLAVLISLGNFQSMGQGGKGGNYIEAYSPKDTTHVARISLAEIKRQVDQLAAKINVPEKMLPTFGRMVWDSHPYITMDSAGFIYYIKSERGQESERIKTTDPAEVLYRAFESVTFWMASDYEVKHRIEDQDSRRILMAKQEELLGILNEEWKEKTIKKYKEILRTYPFDDLAGVRATYCGELRKQGYSNEEIDKLAYTKYPKIKP